MNFRPRTTIKGQALADFKVKFTYTNIVKVTGTAGIAQVAKVVEAQGENNSTLAKGDAEQWTLYVDYTSNDTGYGASIMLISPERHKIHCALCFGFKASNNEAEYEALITRLGLAKKLQARSIQIYSDS